MMLLPLGTDNDCRGSFISLLKSVYETLVCACVCAKLLSFVQLFVTPCSVAHQSPLSMEFSRKGYWSWLPCPSPGDLPDLGIEPGFHAWVGKIPWRRAWQPTPVFLPGESHGQRSLAWIEESGGLQSTGSQRVG